MNKLLVLAVSATLFSIAFGHLTTICSSTDPKKAGEIDFYFGTYHTMKSTPPGTVTISQPDVQGGVKVSGSFSQRFTPKGGKISYGTPDQMKADLIGNGALKNKDALVDCYVVNKQSAAMKAPKTGQWIVPSPKNSKADMACPGSSYAKIQGWSKLTIKGAKSGNWLLEVHGTDQVYNPGQDQCSLSKSNPKWIGGMTVADGSPPCAGAPPVGSDIDADSVKNCADMIGGAECSTFKCNPKLGKNAKQSGHILCAKSKWDVTAKCVGESKCATQALDAINQIKTTTASCQSVVDGMSNGAHCPNELAKLVSDAKTNAKTADTNAKNAAKSYDTAKKTGVKFQPIPLDQINPKDCASLFSKLKANSNYNAAKTALDSAKTADTNAKAAKTAADKAVTDASAQQAKAVLKCKCDTVNKAEDAYDKCTMNQKAEAIQWRKSHHLQCVEMGDVSLNGNKAQGTCTVPATPVVKPKKLAFTVTEKECMAIGMEMEMETDDEMDEAFDEAMPAAMAEAEEDTEDDSMVEAMDEQPKSMPGWHQMGDGTMMKDSDMN
jgi:hypothetical protein